MWDAKHKPTLEKGNSTGGGIQKGDRSARKGHKDGAPSQCVSMAMARYRNDLHNVVLGWLDLADILCKYEM